MGVSTCSAATSVNTAIGVSAYRREHTDRRIGVSAYTQRSAYRRIGVNTAIGVSAYRRYGPEVLWRRPKESTRKAGDPGFPSSHTSNMTFISVYFALYLWLHLNWLPERSLLVALIPSSAMAAARICDKDHTLQQTIAGVIWGALLGLWWALIGPRLRGILEWAQPQPWALVVLCFVVGLPMFTKPLGLRLLPRSRTRRARR
eukprot:s876_g16.t1